MMKNYRLPALPTIEWMRDSLQLGPTSTFSVAVDKIWNWSGSSFITYADDDASENTLLKFRTGGVIRQTQADDWLLSVVCRLFKGGNQFFVENWMIDKTTPFLKSTEIPYVTFNNEVYYFLEASADLPYELFREAFFNFPAGFHAYIIPRYEGLRTGCAIEAKNLEAMSESVKAIISGAYDGEGYVIALQKHHADTLNFE